MIHPTSKPRGLFISGTDTAVGKTIVTSVLVEALTRQEVSTGVMKPIETGAGGDSAWLRTLARVQAPPELITPYRFATKAAPFVAAAREGVTIELTCILSAFHSLGVLSECLLVEGIGGAMVPLAPEVLLTDLMTAMALPVLLVARSGLGSINHSLLTIESLRARGIPLLGFIFNHPTASSPDEEIQRTIPTILQFSGLRMFGELPFCEGLPNSWAEHRERLIAAIDVSGLMEALGLRALA